MRNPIPQSLSKLVDVLFEIKIEDFDAVKNSGIDTLINIFKYFLNKLLLIKQRRKGKERRKYPRFVIHE
jgi:hypothetical protein